MYMVPRFWVRRNGNTHAEWTYIRLTCVCLPGILPLVHRNTTEGPEHAAPGHTWVERATPGSAVTVRRPARVQASRPAKYGAPPSGDVVRAVRSG